MASPVGLARDALKAVYRRLPLRARVGASALLHGETAVQKDIVSRAREASSRIRVEGHGNQVVGGALRPYKAVTVSSFDAWKHLESMRDAVVSALDASSIAVFELPNQTTPVLVVSSADWNRAWEALSTAPELSTFWAEGPKGRPQPTADLRAAPTPGALRVFQYLHAPHGALVSDREIHVRLECWARVSGARTPRVDGGFHAVGTLLAIPSNQTFASYLSPGVQQRLLARPGQPIDWYPNVDAVTEPVDIVYTWVDGSDPVWVAKRASHDGSGTGTVDSQITARFESRDELRYSLRSVEMYAGWYNRIFVVTDGQVPEWLDTDHPRLTVVDHGDLFEPSELPVFNSHAIESRLHHIEGLSELFVYMNDDVFFGRPIPPEIFFTGVGQIKFFPSRAHVDPDDRNDNDVSVTAAAKNNRRLLEQTFGRTFSTKLKHTPHALSTSLLQEMEQRFPDVFRANVASRFRTHDDHSMVSSLAQWYGQAKGLASPGRIDYNYVDVSRPDLLPLLQRWLRARAHDAFCLNDTGLRETDPKVVNGILSSFLTAYFPVPSSLEGEFK